jgi:hypothetical protein
VVAAAASGVTLAPADDLPFLLRARVDALSRMIVAGQAIDASLQVSPRVEFEFENNGLCGVCDPGCVRAHGVHILWWTAAAQQKVV